MEARKSAGETSDGRSMRTMVVFQAFDMMSLSMRCRDDSIGRGEKIFRFPAYRGDFF
jgi:hypothetical protein